MIPIRDTIQSRNYPLVNSIILGMNVLLYMVQKAQGEALNSFILMYGLVPVRYSLPEIASQFSFGQQVLPFFSFMFLHGGFWHLLGNMWSLYIFGDNVEDRLGSFRYLVFYLLCGFLSGLSHLFINWQSNTPTIGASGAIAGVMGAYFLLYPKSRILTLIPIFFIPYFIELPAFFFLGLWFVLQFISAAGTGSQGAGIAWWAHIGGFLSGMIFLKLFLRVPELGITQELRQKTAKKKTHHLQAIKVTGFPNDPHLYGSIGITPVEARSGTRKLVNIPWGFQKRLFRINVPSGIRDGTNLRLAGMGKRADDMTQGDLYLKVTIQ
ncbi:MAG: rhomboid family intramembrane serine protease [Thermodesulfobacteriota bacterium]|nr:rhomboid family intramembrane serine protease [Thermodesulfobacteriota bacterium]